MKKVLTTLLLITAIFNFSIAKKVDPETAKKVATTHLIQIQDFVGTVNLNLAHTYTKNISSVFNPGLLETIPLIYIFNVGDDNGIMLVAGDDVAAPILGYTSLGHFDITDLPYSFKKWLEGYKNQISYAIENNLEAEASVLDNWEELISGTIDETTLENTTVNPLCTTTWNQSPYYNAQCPGGSVT